jgi:hypothetical protein
MGVPTSEVGYTSATTGRGDHEVLKGHVVAMGRKNLFAWEAEQSPDQVWRIRKTNKYCTSARNENERDRDSSAVQSLM